MTRFCSATIANQPFSQKDKAFTLLSRLYMVNSTRAGKDTLLSLTPDFAASLRLALTGGDTQQSFGVPSTEPFDEKIDISFLDHYAQSQWESILHYVVNSVGEGLGNDDGPSFDVRSLLESGNLVERRGRFLTITQAGFSFLLQEVNAQVWNILILFVKNQESDQVSSNSRVAGSVEYANIMYRCWALKFFPFFSCWGVSS